MQLWTVAFIVIALYLRYNAETIKFRIQMFKVFINMIMHVKQINKIFDFRYSNVIYIEISNIATELLCWDYYTAQALQIFTYPF